MVDFSLVLNFDESLYYKQNKNKIFIFYVTIESKDKAKTSKTIKHCLANSILNDS